ncbi:MAG: hypothetical protein EOO25_15380, partial [Comamonadaceae bacterium]
MLTSPAFGQADLTNCERELIHLAGSVQPHGVLLSISDDAQRIVQVSRNCEALLGVAPAGLLGQSLDILGQDLAAAIARAAPSAEPAPVKCLVRLGTGESVEVEGTVHRIAAGVLILEIEPTSPGPGGIAPVVVSQQNLLAHVNESIERFG